VNTIPFAADKVRTKRGDGTLNIILAAGSRMPVIHGKWRRLASGRIKASYTLDEYRRCFEIFQMKDEVYNSIEGDEL
jgi:hypothetical protein